MIARTWHTVVPAAQSDDYLSRMRTIEVPEYLATPGNRAAWCLRRAEGGAAHFQIVTFWDDAPAAADCAGDEYEAYADRSSGHHLVAADAIARVWRGLVHAEKGEAYIGYLLDFGFRDYQMQAGNRGVSLLRRTGHAGTHVLLLSLWSSQEAIAAYAGADIGRAHYYPYDLECLVDPVPAVEHYEVWSGTGERS
jgi:heme-degrading monooxygenase HmoA